MLQGVCDCLIIAQPPAARPVAAVACHQVQIGDTQRSKTGPASTCCPVTLLSNPSTTCCLASPGSVLSCCSSSLILQRVQLLLMLSLVHALQLFMLFLVHAYGGGIRAIKDLRRGLPRSSLHSSQAAEDLLGINAPWRSRWPCLIPWGVAQVVLSVAWLQNAFSKCKPFSLGIARGSSLVAVPCLLLGLCFGIVPVTARLQNACAGLASA